MLTFKDARGFTVAEMLLAMFVHTFGLVAVAAIMGYGIQLQSNVGATGVNLAVAELERLRTLPAGSSERSTGGSLTANVANHFATRGEATVRWVVADDPACGAMTPGATRGPVRCSQNITVVVVPPNAFTAQATVMGMLWQ